MPVTLDPLIGRLEAVPAPAPAVPVNTAERRAYSSARWRNLCAASVWDCISVPVAVDVVAKELLKEFRIGSFAAISVPF
jgi:hypothetical protein